MRLGCSESLLWFLPGYRHKDEAGVDTKSESEEERLEERLQELRSRREARRDARNIVGETVADVSRKLEGKDSARRARAKTLSGPKAADSRQQSAKPPLGAPNCVQRLEKSSKNAFKTAQVKAKSSQSVAKSSQSVAKSSQVQPKMCLFATFE